MDWIEIANLTVGIFGTVVGIVGGSVGIIYWRENKAIKSAEAQKSKTDARLAEADLAEKILEKYEKGILARMDQGETVRKQELDALRTDLGGQLTDIQVENRTQNETIASQNELLQDIKEYLNGGFAEFENRKHQKPTKTKKKV